MKDNTMSTSSNPESKDPKFFVFADYGYITENQIASGTYDEMRIVYDRETSDPSRMDCSMYIELSSLEPSGEYIVHEKQTLPSADISGEF
jgi:hypothetical protein